MLDILSGIDSRTWFIAGGVVGLLALISFFKKAIKTGITILIIAVAITYGGKAVSSIKDSVGIVVTDGTIKIDNKYVGVQEFKLAEVRNVVISNGKSEDAVTIEVVCNGKTHTMESPSKVVGVIKSIIGKTDIEVIDLRK